MASECDTETLHVDRARRLRVGLGRMAKNRAAGSVALLVVMAAVLTVAAVWLFIVTHEFFVRIVMGLMVAIFALTASIAWSLAWQRATSSIGLRRDETISFDSHYMTYGYWTNRTRERGVHVEFCVDLDLCKVRHAGDGLYEFTGGVRSWRYSHGEKKVTWEAMRPYAKLSVIDWFEPSLAACLDVRQKSGADKEST